MISVKQLLNNPIDSNCFVIFDKTVGGDCVIVDPGSEDNRLLYKFLDSVSLNPEFIILTHEHFDHCWGVNELRTKYPKVKLICSATCSEAIQHKKKNYSVFHQQPGFELVAADVILDVVDWVLNWNGYDIRFVPAQGHSAAGIIFYIDTYVFTGDTLIKDIKTVTKLKTASFDKLKESLSLLEGEKGRGLVVCPGHGEIFGLDDYDLSKAIYGHCTK